MALTDGLRESLKNQEIESFGECEAREIRNLETGDSFTVQCDNKQCPICGMKKGTNLMYAIRATCGPFPYVMRVDTKDELDRILERAKKRKQRGKLDYAYFAVGDDFDGFILLTDVPLDRAARQMDLASWRDRIIISYRYGRRIRLTRGLVTLSLFVRDITDRKGRKSRYAMVDRDRWRKMVDNIDNLAMNDQIREERGLVWNSPSETLSTRFTERVDIPSFPSQMSLS